MTVIRAWNRFWFEPEPASTMAVIRIAVGLVVLVWTLSLAPDLHNFYTRTGIVPGQPHFPFFWGILGHWHGTGLVVPGPIRPCSFRRCAIWSGDQGAYIALR